MKKIITIAIAAVATLLISIVVINSLNVGFNKTYTIEQSGYTYDANGVLEFPSGTRYQQKGLYKQSDLLINGKPYEIDAAGVLFYSEDTLEIMNNSIVVVNKKEIQDLAPLTLVKNEQEIFSLQKNNEEFSQLPKGSIVKLNEGRYLILDTVSLQNNHGFNRKIDSDYSVVAIDDNGKTRLFHNQKEEEVLSNSMYISLENRFCNFFLNEEYLECSNKDESMDLRTITVNFEDNVPSKDEIHSSNNNEETTENNETTENTSSNGGGNDGDSSGDAQAVPEINVPNYPDIPELETGDYTIPTISAYAMNKGNLIYGESTLSTHGIEILELSVSLVDEQGQVVKKQVLDKYDGTEEFSFGNLALNQKFEVIIEGTYKGNKGDAVQTTFYRKVLYLDTIQFDATIKDRFADSLMLELESQNSEMNYNNLQIAVYTNDGNMTEVDSVDIDVATLNTEGKAMATFKNLSSDSSYIIKVKNATIENQVITSSDSQWYVVGQTTKALPTVGKAEVTVAEDKVFTLTTNPMITDKDNAATSVQYVAFEKSDYEANGIDAERHLSVTKNNLEIAMPAVVVRPVNMEAGSYVFVGIISYNDTKELGQISTEVSEEIQLASQKKDPMIDFTADYIGMSMLTISYSIEDADHTIVYDSQNLATIEIYMADADGNAIGTPISPIQNTHPITSVEKTGTVEFRGLKAETSYVVKYQTKIDKADGQGIQDFITYSLPFNTLSVQPHTALFKDLQKATNNSVEINVSIDGLYKKEITTGTLEIDDMNGTIIYYPLSDTEMSEALSSAGANIIINNLESPKTFKISFSDLKDTGENQIPISGDIVVQTIVQKSMPTVDFLQPVKGSSSTQLMIEFQVHDTDNAIMTGGSHISRIEVKEEISEGIFDSTAKQTIFLTPQQIKNTAKQTLHIKNLEEEKNYQLSLVADVDLQDSMGVQAAVELNTAGEYTTSRVEPVEATYSVESPNGIHETSIEFNLQLSETARWLDEGVIRIYNVDTGQKLTHEFPVQDNLPELINAAGADYQVDGLTPQTNYQIKVEDMIEGNYAIPIVGGNDGNGNFNFTTAVLKNIPVAHIAEDTSVVAQTKLAIDYEITDTDATIQFNATYLALYGADIYGNITGDVLKKMPITLDTELVGSHLFEGLVADTNYIVAVHADYDLGDGNIHNVILGQSALLKTAGYETILSEFTLLNVGLTTVEYEVKLTENAHLLQDGKAQLQFFEYDATAKDFIGRPATPSVTLTAKNIEELVNGQTIKMSQTNLEKSNKYIVAFVQAKNSINDILFIDGNLILETLDEKEEPSVVFGVPELTSTSIDVEYVIKDPDTSLVVTPFKPAKFVMYEVGAQGEDLEESAKTIRTAYSLSSLCDSDNKGSLSVGMLKNNQKYRIYLEASYNLEDGQGEQKKILQSHLLFSTTDIAPVQFLYSNILDEITKEQLGIEMQLVNAESIHLNRAEIQLYQQNGVTKVGTPIQLSDVELNTLEIAPKEVIFSEETIGVKLSSNSTYIVKVIEMYDEANNVVPVSNDYSLVTRKTIPLIDSIAVKTTASTIISRAANAQMQNNQVIDSDHALTKLTYSLYKFEEADLLAENINEDIEAIYDEVIFDLPSLLLPVGESYQITLTSEWFDNYETLVITPDILSAKIEVLKELPNISYEFIERTATTTTIKIVTKDEDGSIVPGTLITTSDTGEQITLTDNEQVLSLSNAQEITTSGTIELVSGTQIQNYELQFASLEPIVDSVNINNHSIKYDNQQITASFGPLNTQTNKNGIFSQTQITNHENEFTQKGDKKNGASIFEATNLVLPNDSFDLWFDDASRNMSVENTLHYKENYIQRNDAYIKDIIIADANTSGSYLGYNTGTNKYMKTQAANTIASFVVIENKVDATNNITDVILQNKQTEKYLAITNSGELTEVSQYKDATYVNFILQDNGSYQFMDSSARGIDLASGSISTSPSVVQIYSANVTTQVKTESITVPKLIIPTATITSPITVRDTQATVSTVFLDKDKTITAKKLELALASDPQSILQTAILTGNSNKKTFTNLQPAENYIVTVKASYDLKEAPGGVGQVTDEVLASESFKTVAVLPSASSSTYKWISNVCGNPGTPSAARTNGILEYSDVSGVVEDIVYVWYPKNNNGLDYSDLTAMQTYFDNPANAAIATYTQTTGGQTGNAITNNVQMDMFTDTISKATQNYKIGDYIVAAYLQVTPGEFASFPDDKILARVNEVKITGPSTDAGIVQVPPGIGTNLAHLGFRYTSDEENILGGCGNTNKPFTYELIDDNELIIESGAFELNDSTKEWTMLFQSLEQNKTYTLRVVSNHYNDYKTIGKKEFEYKFNTLKKYIVVDSFVIDSDSTNIEAKVEDIIATDATIQSVKLEMYKLASEGNPDSGYLISSADVTAGPYSHKQLKTSGVYYSKVIITYKINGTNTIEVHEQETYRVKIV